MPRCKACVRPCVRAPGANRQVSLYGSQTHTHTHTRTLPAGGQPVCARGHPSISQTPEFDVRYPGRPATNTPTTARLFNRHCGCKSTHTHEHTGADISFSNLSRIMRLTQMRVISRGEGGNDGLVIIITAGHINCWRYK